jgi:plasmid stabilization system protein ParE
VKVVFSRNARQELEDIADWIARDNPERARTFVVDLVKRCKAVGRAPYSYPFVDRSRDSALRRRIYRNYLIFFDIRAREVQILHILHGARDYGQIVFANDEPE